jgi:ribosomal protein S21
MSKRNTHTNVKVDSNNFDSFERMLRRFLKKCKKERIIEQVKERRYYEKPSVTERKAKLAGMKKERKRQREFEQKINSNERLNNNSNNRRGNK